MERVADPEKSCDFFQAVRLIQAARPDLPPVGSSRDASHDAVRFAQQPSLAFPATSIGGWEPIAGSSTPRLFVNFMGLLGPAGPLPLHLTSHIRFRQRNCKDAASARFLDVFNHRMVCLFFKAWRVNNMAVCADRPGQTRFFDYIGALCGLGMSSLQNQDSVPLQAKLHYSGRLMGLTRNSEGLASILRGYFQVPLEIQEFIGRWIDIPKVSQCRLGESPASGMLGRTSVAGSRVHDVQSMFRIRMGPLSLADYERLLPGGSSFRRLIDWVRTYLGDQLDFQVQLVLDKREVPPVKLGRRGRLGHTTWLGSKPHSENPDNLLIQPHVC